MTNKDKMKESPQRQYPPVYEKLVPVAIGLIVLLVVGMLALTLAIATGVISAG